MTGFHALPDVLLAKGTRVRVTEDIAAEAMYFPGAKSEEVVSLNLPAGTALSIDYDVRRPEVTFVDHYEATAQEGPAMSLVMERAYDLVPSLRELKHSSPHTRRVELSPSVFSCTPDDYEQFKALIPGGHDYCIFLEILDIGRRIRLLSDES